MSTQVKIQVPMDKATKDKLLRRAKDRGFDSLQAYIRFWAKSEVDGRVVDFGDDWGEPSPEAAARLNKAAEEAKKGINVSQPFYTVEEALGHLHSL